MPPKPLDLLNEINEDLARVLSLRVNRADLNMRLRRTKIKIDLLNHMATEEFSMDGYPAPDPWKRVYAKHIMLRRDIERARGAFDIQFALLNIDMEILMGTKTTEAALNDYMPHLWSSAELLAHAIQLHLDLLRRDHIDDEAPANSFMDDIIADLYLLLEPIADLDVCYKFRSDIMEKVFHRRCSPMPIAAICDLFVQIMVDVGYWHVEVSIPNTSKVCKTWEIPEGTVEKVKELERKAHEFLVPIEGELFDEDVKEGFRQVLDMEIPRRERNKRFRKKKKKHY